MPPVYKDSFRTANVLLLTARNLNKARHNNSQPLTHFHTPNSTLMSNQTNSCSRSGLPGPPNEHACGIPLMSRYNDSIPNNNMIALKTCCPQPYQIATYGWFAEPDEHCYIYCNATSKQETYELSWCLSNYTNEANHSIGNIGCFFSSDAVPQRSSVWSIMAITGLAITMATTAL